MSNALRDTKKNQLVVEIIFNITPYAPYPIESMSSYRSSI